MTAAGAYGSWSAFSQATDSTCGTSYRLPTTRRSPVTDDAEVTIEVAKPEELSSVLALLDEAAGWLKSRGIDQWPASFSGDATWRTDRIRSYIEHGLTYLARNRSGQ